MESSHRIMHVHTPLSRMSINRRMLRRLLFVEILQSQYVPAMTNADYPGTFLATY
ncbi:conserved hypothetical protein [Ricinus communis]|uniref:Uncharacterized protein n=1 Tax=Ricinus communis TaxID=3988 RepID=B9RLQ9_RICCO|nr:conserved hypothetical protein [Ricinus communis]